MDNEEEDESLSALLAKYDSSSYQRQGELSARKSRKWVSNCTSYLRIFASYPVKGVSRLQSDLPWFTLWFTLCSPTSRSTNQWGLGLSGLSMKKPIRLSLIYTNQDFKMLMLEASTVRWSSKFHLLITLLKKKYFTISLVHRVFTNLHECPLVPLIFSSIIKSSCYWYFIDAKLFRRDGRGEAAAV